MKKIGGLLFLLTVLAVPLFGVTATAAACSNSSSFGAVELKVPELPNTDARILWVRMQVPTSSGRVLAEINKSQCLEIGGQITPDQWSWQRSSDDPIMFSSTNANSIKLIGVTDGLKIDRVLLAKPDCVPSDFGNNCRDSVELKQVDDASVTSLTPPSHGSVHGKVVLSQTPAERQSELDSVEYIVDGDVIQVHSSPEPFDTTLLPNGKYTIFIYTTLKDGVEIRESTVIDVRNAENVLSPAIRWARQNGQLLERVGLITGGLLLVSVLVMLGRKRRSSRRFRKFHGF